MARQCQASYPIDNTRTGLVQSKVENVIFFLASESLNSLTKKIAEFANNIDLDEVAHFIMSHLIQIYTVCPLVF